VSVSSDEKISSTLMSGSELETGNVYPAGATGETFEPGFISMNMSSRPVFGRSSRVAFSCTSFRYCWSMSIWTTARPLRSVTAPIAPTCTPEMRIVCPWPGVTACSVWNSALRVYCGDEKKGKRNRSLLRMYTATTIESRSRTMIAAKSGRCFLIARFTAFHLRRGSAGRASPYPSRRRR